VARSRNSQYDWGSMKDVAVIDVHAMLGREDYLALDADELRRRMEAHQVEAAIARPMGAELVVDNAAGNTRVLEAGEPVHGMVSVNPWYGDRAIDELRRCHDHGAVGLFLHPSRQGFMPTESVATPLLEQAARFGWPVMFHTGTYIQSDVLAVGEAARRYPDTPFILGCSGFADMWFEIPGIMGEAPNLWLETSMILGNGLRKTIAAHGTDRVLFGSAEPRNRYAAALRTLARLNLTESQLHAILYDNTKRLFELP